jgi:hypothetical protein
LGATNNNNVVPPMSNNTVSEYKVSDNMGTSQPAGEAQASERNPGISIWQMGRRGAEAIEIGRYQHFQPDRKNVRKGSR